MQYLVKDMVVCFACGVIGAFVGMFFKYAYGIMVGSTSPVLGLVLCGGTILVVLLYEFLLKKFVMGTEASMLFPTICLALGAWVGWTNYLLA